MAYQRFEVNFPILSSEDLAAWREIPPAVASDCMNRTQVMDAAIKPVMPGTVLCGQARTVTGMVGDCGIVCIACVDARAGEIVVVDSDGVEDTAVWGAVMTEAAVIRGIGGAVIDGAVRDVAEIRESGLPMFCRSVVPRGPHEGFGGIIDARISVAGVPVSPGDIVLGNDDGVTVVPLERASQILVAAQAHLKKEEDWLRKLKAGKTIPEVFEMPTPEVIGRGGGK